jgi:hypothetical protein
MNIAKLRPFVLRCPQCMAPTEQGSTHCRYCAVPLAWEPEKPVDRDDSKWVYTEPTPEEKGLVILGFGPSIIGSDGMAVLQCQPQLPVKPQRLFIPKAVAILCSIVDLRIGMDSQFVSSAHIPAERFCESETGILDMDACPVGMIISLTVQNNTASVLTFSAALDCKRLEFDYFMNSVRSKGK